MPCLIGYDSTSAAAVAAATGVDRNDTELGRGCRALMHILYLMHCDLRWLHIKSHQGHPLNELADAAAKHGARSGDSDHLSNALHEAQIDQVLPWLWASLGLHQDVPMPDSGGLLADAASITHQSLTLSDVKPSSTIKGTLEIQLRAATYNCLTLQSRAQQESLSQQFNKAGIAAVGLQETRTAWSGRGTNLHYHTLGSSACKGQLGCQLWLSRTRAVAICEGQLVHWNPASMSVIIAQPRLLLATARAGSVLFAFLVGHCPTAKSGQKVCDEFWSSVSSALRRIPPRSVPVLLLDANAHSGPEAHSREGEQPGSVNQRGLQNILEAHRMSSSGHTDTDGRSFHSWKGPDGQLACIDFVCCPTASSAGMKVDGPIPGFVGYLDHDRRPIAVCINWQVTGASPARGPRLDVDILHTPTGQAALRKLHRCMPAVGWDCFDRRTSSSP